MPDQLRIVPVERRKLLLGNKLVPFRDWRLFANTGSRSEMNRHNLL